MSFVAVAIGGSAVIGAGASIGSSLIGASAARRAQGGALGQLDQANQMLQLNLEGLQALYAPYIAAGTNTLNILQGRIYSSTERQVANKQQLIALQSKIKALSKPTDWNSFPVLTGEMASERRASLFTEKEAARKTQLQAAQNELEQYNRTQTELAPLYAKQDAENAQRMGRITSSLDRIAKLSDLPTSLAGIRTELQNDPVYQFRQAEGERSINRAAAQRGQFFSGSAIGNLANFSLALTGEETDKYVNRQVTALNAAVTGLGAELGEQGQSVNQALSLANIGAQAVQGQAAATVGTNQSQAALSGQASQVVQGTTLAQGQAQQQGLGQISSMAGSLATLSLLTQPKVVTTSSSTTAAQRTWPAGGPTPY